MIGFKISDAKSMFFDRQAVMSAVDKGTRKVLSKFGAFVRTRAKSSIRKSKKSAAPGQPPRSHTGLLKRFIFFVFEPINRSVVIGPAKLNAKESGAPEVLEKGGTTVVSQTIRVGKQKRKAKKRVAIAARPYMGPAYEAEKKELPALWANSVKSDLEEA
jgi:hypothetical protein